MRREDGKDGAVYRAPQFFVAVGAPSGWEAAVFDHFHAVVRTICSKLRKSTQSSSADQVGGSTYSFEIWDGHPLASEVLGALERFRREHSALRERVRAHNAAASKPAARFGVVVYGGQTVWSVDDGKESTDV